jgi:hypothetical protein
MSLQTNVDFCHHEPLYHHPVIEVKPEVNERNHLSPPLKAETEIRAWTIR